MKVEATVLVVSQLGRRNRGNRWQWYSWDLACLRLMSLEIVARQVRVIRGKNGWQPSDKGGLKIWPVEGKCHASKEGERRKGREKREGGERGEK